MLGKWGVRLRRPQLALLVLVAALGVGYAVTAVRGDTRHTPHETSVTLSSLPPQAATTVRLIQRGGPYPHQQDGVVFGNNEHRLPEESRGYYHEYTVDTPGSPDRGARRIITGKDGTFYYTADRYETFVRVDVTR